MELKVGRRLVLNNVPSASGVEFYAGHLYITADNSPWLFKLNLKGELLEQYPIYDSVDLQDQTIPKKLKPDFEAMTTIEEQGETFFYVFGSGSKSPYRDVLIKIAADNPQNSVMYAMSGFYNQLKKAFNFPDEHFNIEAAASVDDELLFFNRGTNDMIRVKISEFNSFLSNPDSSFSSRRNHFILPSINGIESRFSGCTSTPGWDKILFTASVEDTADWISDGEVLGSFIGITSLSDVENKIAPAFFQIEKRAGPPLKIESIAIISSTPNSAEIVMVSDNDDGQSELLEAALTW